MLSVVPRYFRAKQPIAMSLTSGLDTRSIMSCISAGPGELPCFTFTGIKRDTLDVRIAQKVATACHQTHQVLRLDEKFLADFPKLAERTIYITDGYLDVCGTYDIYYNELARHIAPIRMTGKFGSEILGSLSMLKNTIRYNEELFHHDFKKYIDEAVRTFNDIKKGHKLSFAVFSETPWYQYGRLAMEMSKLTVRTPYMDNDLIKLMYQAPPQTRASKEIRFRLIEDGNPELSKIMTDRGNLGEYNYLISTCAQMFYYSLFKAEYIYLYQLPYWMPKLDKVFSSILLEKLLVGRYQLSHYRKWFQKPLSNYMREILLDGRTARRPYFNKEFIEKMVSLHSQGKYNYLNEINKTISVELIHRHLIEET
jgi:asparagine synthase (glutamine-hydrolysing)